MDMTESIDVLHSDSCITDTVKQYYVEGMSEYPSLFSSNVTSINPNSNPDEDCDNSIPDEMLRPIDVTQWTSYSSDIIKAEFDDVIKRFSNVSCSQSSSDLPKSDSSGKPDDLDPPRKVPNISQEVNEYPVRLNVGGVWHTTLPSTLTRFPGSKLSELIGSDPDPGYYFIDRDGSLFHIILNFLRSSKLILPAGFRRRAQLLEEARFYRLQNLQEVLTTNTVTSSDTNGSLVDESIPPAMMIELIEISQPDLAGLSGARIVLTDDLLKVKPFSEVIAASHTVPEKVAGSRGRFWLGTDLTRCEWGEMLIEHEWTMNGMSSFSRSLTENSKNSTDTTYIIEKWLKTRSEKWHS